MASILIIDDDSVVGLTLSRMLELDGHSVICVGTAQEGLEHAAENRPDAVILDIRMPGIGGLAFLRQLRNDVRLRALPVGIITGDYFLTEQALAEIGALGATVRYKPVWLADLSELAKTLLDGTKTDRGQVLN